jgi:putative chitinase
MTPAEAKIVQARIGTAVDGAFGRGSWTALLMKMGAGPERARELALGAAVHAPGRAIDATPLRLAHFLAQLAHESDGWLAMEEYASGSAYEGRADLGNSQAGDGRRFKGRGPLQLTGRANYRRVGQAIGIDLEAHPEVAALPSVGMLTASVFWETHRLNELADGDDLFGITRVVNGGTNGLEDRRTRLAAAKALLL